MYKKEINLITLAKILAAEYLNRKVIVKGDKEEKVKDIIVTFPDNAVYVNSDKDRILEHAKAKDLNVLILMKDGEVIPDDHEVVRSTREVEVRTRAGVDPVNNDDPTVSELIEACKTTDELEGLLNQVDQSNQRAYDLKMKSLKKGDKK